MQLRDIQQRAWANKVAKGFNTTDVAVEFGLLTAEVGEAFIAWRRDLPDLGEELADVLLFLTSIATMTGVDLNDAVQAKLAKNERRVYRHDERGVAIRVSEE
jgi:NTP pyrophosphatase (non-canonical NTP hydrolase)